MEGGGWLWILVALGLIGLGVVLTYNIHLWRHRRKDPETKARTDAATRRHYREGE